jgi:peptidyl-prolyl cis-trans isomerase C
MYEADPDSFSRKETAKVSHVLVAVPADVGAEQKEQARQEAERIRKEILAGKDFAEAAKEYSDCNSAAGGGVLEPVKRGYMPPEFDDVAFSLEKDAVSAVVETKFGYHIIKLLDKQPDGVIPYEEMRDFLRKYLQEEESKKKLAAHIAELREKSDIEILLK